ncbi:MAG: GNAT family N-acetyltransferase [Actinomycetota bacterium]
MASSEHAPPTGYATRAATRDDVAELGDIWRRSDEALGVHPESVASFLGWVLQLPYVQHGRDTIVLKGNDGAAGFAIAMRDPASAGSAMHWFGVVDPAQQGRSLGAWLLTWADRLVGARADELPFNVRSMFPAPDDAARRLFTSRGYTHVRTSWDMHRDVTTSEPAGEPPDDVTIRAFRLGQDERTFWSVSEAAFADHFGFTPAPYESWEGEWYRSEEWNPDRVLFAERDGEVIGELAWIDAAPDGYVASLGVLEAHRGRGIAKALLRRAFADIASAGLDSATLSVDTENATGAVELYRSVGMRPVRESFIFERPPE